ncbi:hypothetical protein M2650_05395 [Luteimonas sp. SX5]|uniref:DUF4386 family protein n=1 Tax=Luteimonas galliterrae TaxID=2940486 RepID=A0ABT0MGR4_9GAMM|nr:hypothetical protein [Luteimonas galliterrae]MCL1634066.1 hypothetical protein [Luteimonas galliterrae]
MSTSAQTVATPEPELVTRLLRGAWLGIILGLLIEGMLLAVQLFQGQLPEPVRIAADTVQKISWSSLVCAVLAAGQAVARGAGGLAGLAGLIGAPIAFLLARSLHKATLEVLGSEAAGGAVPWLAAGIKGAEYALLGAAILWLAKNERGWKAHVLLGLLVGLVTYLLTLWLLPGAGNAIQRAITEIAHPVGCALAVFIALQFNRRMGQNTAGD